MCDFLYMKQEIQQAIYVEYGLQWHWFIETYRLLSEQFIVFVYGKACECYHEENELTIEHQI